MTIPIFARSEIRLTGNRKCGEDPAVGVEHVARDARAQAVDGLAPEVVGGDEEGGHEADRGRGAVVQLPAGRVDVGLGAAVPHLDHARHGHQQSHHSHGCRLLGTSLSSQSIKAALEVSNLVEL